MSGFLLLSLCALSQLIWPDGKLAGLARWKNLSSYPSSVTCKLGDLELVLYLSSFSFLLWKIG